MVAIPIYVVCKARGSTITCIGCEVPKKEGKQILEKDIACRYEKIGEVFHYYFKVGVEAVYFGEERLNFDNSSVEVQINVRSHDGRKTPKLEYLFKENLQVLDEEKVSLSELAEIDYGINVLNYEKQCNKESRIVLDYIRSNLFSMNEFIQAPTTIGLNEEIHKYIKKVKNENLDIYIWGDLYPIGCRGDEARDERLWLLRENGPKGIHDVHMNQGNSEKKQAVEDNDMYQDGGILIHFKLEDGDRWDAIFFKFEDQHKEIKDD